jgi:hypothetical protein
MITASVSLFGFDLFGSAKRTESARQCDERELSNLSGAGGALHERERDTLTTGDARTQRDEGFYWLRHPIY